MKSIQNIFFIVRVAKNSIAVSSTRLFEIREQEEHNKGFCVPVNVGISNFSILVRIVDAYSGWLSFHGNLTSVESRRILSTIVLTHRKKGGGGGRENRSCLG